MIADILADSIVDGLINGVKLLGEGLVNTFKTNPVGIIIVLGLIVANALLKKKRR